jgi:hypothetical protein
MITFGSIINYLQSLQKLSELPLMWPELLETAFGYYLQHLSIWGVLELIHVKYQCVTGNHFTAKLTLEFLLPLAPFCCFTILGALGRLFNLSLSWDLMINATGMIFKGVFITITGLTLQLFVKNRMPNEKFMVRALPELEYGSDEWKNVLPFALLACCVYHRLYRNRSICSSSCTTQGSRTTRIHGTVPLCIWCSPSWLLVVDTSTTYVLHEFDFGSGFTRERTYSSLHVNSTDYGGCTAGVRRETVQVLAKHFC